jgi:hypothetical protein
MKPTGHRSQHGMSRRRDLELAQLLLRSRLALDECRRDKIGEDPDTVHRRHR